MIEYTNYKFSVKSSACGQNPYTITGDKVAGIVMCDNKAVIPLSMIHGNASKTAANQV